MNLKQRALLFFFLGAGLHTGLVAWAVAPSEHLFDSALLMLDFPIGLFYLMVAGHERLAAFVAGGLYWGVLSAYASVALPALLRFVLSDWENVKGVAVQIFFALLAMGLAVWAVA